MEQGSGVVNKATGVGAEKMPMVPSDTITATISIKVVVLAVWLNLFAEFEMSSEYYAD